ncbi:MAG: prolyl oligopeptidase family serine peptidase [Polyangia bacterium]
MPGTLRRVHLALRVGAGAAALLGACASPRPEPAPGASPPPPTKPAPLQYVVGGQVQFGTLYPPPGASPQSAEPSAEPSTKPPATQPLAQRPPPVQHPAVVLLHGGFFGDDSTTDGMARELSRRGVLAAFPAYRGEPRGLDGARSQGRIEFCEGEVRDALALVRLLRARPDVDPRRIAVLGFSHGGCIGLRMLAEDPTLRAGVLFSPLSDARNAVENMDQNPLQMLGFAGWLGARLRSYVSRDPRPRDEAWSARSPVLVASTLRMPMVIVHGTSDPLIPLLQTCRLRDTLWKSGRPVRERLLTNAGLPSPAAVAQAAALAPAQSIEDPQALAAQLPCGPLPPRPDPSAPAGPRPVSAPSADPSAGADATDPAALAASPPAVAEFWYLTGQGHLLSQPCKQRVEAMALQALLTLLN